MFNGRGDLWYILKFSSLPTLQFDFRLVCYIWPNLTHSAVCTQPGLASWWRRSLYIIYFFMLQFCKSLWQPLLSLNLCVNLSVTGKLTASFFWLIYSEFLLPSHGTNSQEVFWSLWQILWVTWTLSSSEKRLISSWDQGPHHLTVNSKTLLCDAV